MMLLNNISMVAHCTEDLFYFIREDKSLGINVFTIRDILLETEITNVNDGIILMLESESKTFCLFADKLIGKQQVVVKSLPKCIKNIKKLKEWQDLHY